MTVSAAHQGALSTKLSEAERKILSLVELDADMAAPEIAKRAKLKTPTVHRALQNFRESGLFAGRTAVIDTGRIGLVEYGIGISLGAIDAAALEAFYQYSQRKRSISWIADVGGEFDVFLNVLARRPQAALDILLEIEKKFPGLLQEKVICIRTRRFRFWRGYLNGRISKAPRFAIGVGSEEVNLSAEDSIVLGALCKVRFETSRELARSLGMPIATFLRRVRSLRERKVLLGFGYRMNLDLIGVQQFRVLIFTTKCSPQTEQQMLAFAAECPWIKVVTSCLGPWSFELEIDVIHQSTAREVAAGIRRELGSAVRKILLLPIFTHRKFISFPPPD